MCRAFLPIKHFIYEMRYWNSIDVNQYLASASLGSTTSLCTSTSISFVTSLLFRHLHQVYRGYVDDPRNTDNAWMEAGIQLSRRSEQLSRRHQLQGRHVQFNVEPNLMLDIVTSQCCLTCQGTTRVTYAGWSWVAIWSSMHRTSTFSSWSWGSTMSTGSWAYICNIRV